MWDQCNCIAGMEGLYFWENQSSFIILIKINKLNNENNGCSNISEAEELDSAEINH